MSYDLLKNRLANGIPFIKEIAVTRINALADELEITQEQADELTALANSNGLDELPKDANERLENVEKAADILYRLIEAMKNNVLLSTIVDKLNMDERIDQNGE